MDDQTRGDVPGTGQGDADAPMKRDRKLLRSSKPLPPRVSPETESRPESRLPPDGAPSWPPAPVTLAPVTQAPYLTQTNVEDLFNDQRTASLTAPAMPTSGAPPSSLAGPQEMPPSQQKTAPFPQPQPVLGDEHSETAGYSATGRPDLSRQITPHSGPSHSGPSHPGPSHPGTSHPRLGPLAPEPLDSHPALARLDLAALVTAILLPPVGLILGVIASVRGKAIRGWSSDLARTAIVVSIVMTVAVTAVGGYAGISAVEKAQELAQLKAAERAHASLVATSKPFCGMLAENPTIYGTEDPDYGWPQLDAPEGYLAAIANYSALWAQIAEIAPEGIAAESAAISERVAGVVGIATALGSNNRAGDLLGFHEKEDLATVEAWFVDYCPQG